VHGRTPRRGHGAAQHLTADAGVEDRLGELAPRVLGVLVRRDEDFAGCEDAVQEALVAAAQHWPKEGVPGNPRSWLVTAASRAVVDEWRSVRARRRREEAVAALEPPDQAAPSGRDDSLALLLMCCHPVLPVPSQLALTLRAVGGSHHSSMCLPRHQVSAFQPLLTRWSHSNIEPYGWDLSRATSGYSSAGP
jgi:predicted RNA polymerase sigma factor